MKRVDFEFDEIMAKVHGDQGVGLARIFFQLNNQEDAMTAALSINNQHSA